jgi:endonuclease-8
MTIMEGPSLVIASEEFAPFAGRKVSRVLGTMRPQFSFLKGKVFSGAKSWGKHFLLRFGDRTLRIHFLMFGSYRIDNPRENRKPKLVLTFGTHAIDFYSCAIKELDEDVNELYDWSIDVMSKKWNSRKALVKIKKFRSKWSATF